jgi:hypothetical protein
MIASPRLMDPHPASTDEFLAFLFAYIDLLVARSDALACGLPARAAPVSLSRLRARGVGDGVVLWLLYHAHVEHLRQGPDAVNGESPGAWESLRLSETSRFVLTADGETFADQFLALILEGDDDSFEAGWDMLQLGRLLPCYDTEERALTWGRHVLKCFRQPSLNQELVLRTAEELGWPRWFDDALPRVPGTSPKVRLHDTIKALNRHQNPYLIHFKGDGTGTRVGWEYR